MLKRKSRNARAMLSSLGWMVVVAFAWLTVPVGIGDVVPLVGPANAQTTQSDPEGLRTALRDLLETQQDTAVMIGNTNAQEIIAQGLEQLELLTWDELALLDGLERQIAVLQSSQDALYGQLEILGGDVPNLGEVIQQSAQNFSALPQSFAPNAAYTGLTDAGYGAICSHNPFGDPSGGPNRSNPDVNQGFVTAITISDVTVAVAEGVRDAADVICNIVVVILGEGGNPQGVACAVTSSAYIVAKAINEALKIALRLLTFCDATIDAAEIEGAFERTSDLYDQNTDLDADLVIHDANLATHDVDIKALLAIIQETVDENQRLLRTPPGLRAGFPLLP